MYFYDVLYLYRLYYYILKIKIIGLYVMKRVHFNRSAQLNRYLLIH